MKQEQNKLRAGTKPTASSKRYADSAHGRTATGMKRSVRILCLVMAAMLILSALALVIFTSAR